MNDPDIRANAETLNAELRISDEEFRRFSGIVHQGFGIKLTPEKKTLVVGRLQKMLRERGDISFGEYFRQLESDPSGRELSELINRISTNHTFFNREKEHFDFFRTIALPEATARAKARGGHDLRVWCAAASTGEEPYMLAMLIREHLGPMQGQWEAGLLATDISARALETAAAGIYSEERVADIPPALLKKYFVRLENGDYSATPALKRDITYRRFNLINPEFPFRKPFDSVFCRNVMIYFDNPTKDALVRKIARFTVPGGYLFIGHAETLGRDTGPWQYVRPAVYRRREAI
jgi:chemotaxis protein methyltransferase CheR